MQPRQALLVFTIIVYPTRLEFDNKGIEGKDPKTIFQAECDVE